MAETKTYLSIAEVARLTGTGRNNASALIRNLNEEMMKDGYVVINHRISTKYLCERLNLDLTQVMDILATPAPPPKTKRHGNKEKEPGSAAPLRDRDEHIPTA